VLPRLARGPGLAARGRRCVLIGVHCDLAETGRRERDRADRRPGEGRAHAETGLIHTFGPYDFDAGTTHGVSSAITESVLAAWRTRACSRACCPGHPACEDATRASGSGDCVGRSHPPYYRGHSAAACIAGHEAQGKVVEVSWAVLEDLDRRALMGIEVDLIAACRMRFGESPACQFHGRPME